MARRTLITVVMALTLAAIPMAARAGAAIHARGLMSDLQATASNPTDGAWATVTAVGRNGRTVVVLNVEHLDVTAAGTTLGAHVHVGPCVGGDGAAAGPHYNSTGQPPTLVSPETEVWLDFQISDEGTGHAIAMVPFEIPAGGAQSIVIHALPTNPATGAAGTRLACIGVGF